MPDRHPSLYTDGGLLTTNPCPLGGTWAFVVVDADGSTELHRDSGYFTAASTGLPAVSCNVSEVYAIVMGLEWLADGWAGQLNTDSRVAMLTAQGAAKSKGKKWLPAWWVERLAAAVRRHGGWTTRLLAGHPSKADLKVGYRASRNNMPVSRWNVLCDQLATGHRDAGRAAAGAVIA